MQPRLTPTCEALARERGLETVGIDGQADGHADGRTEGQQPHRARIKAEPVGVSVVGDLRRGKGGWHALFAIACMYYLPPVDFFTQNPLVGSDSSETRRRVRRLRR